MSKRMADLEATLKEMQAYKDKTTGDLNAAKAINEHADTQKTQAETMNHVVASMFNPQPMMNMPQMQIPQGQPQQMPMNGNPYA